MEKELLARSVVSTGDPVRIKNVFYKASRGEPVTVGVIGGSITAGCHAGKEEDRWADRVAAWWTRTFPQSEITLVNAGIGATGSDFACHRVQPHLLDKHPDFVVVEFAVNDASNPLVADTYEGLLRQILAAPGDPAVLLFFTLREDGSNVQDVQAKIGKHYGLPMTSVRDALWPEIAAGRLAWTDYSGDRVHPNAWGHGQCAECITGLLDDLLRQGIPDTPEPVPAIPARISTGSARFEKTWFKAATEFSPVSNSGWQPDPNGRYGGSWKADKSGSTLVLEAEAELLSLIFWRIRGEQGMVSVQVDNNEPEEFDAWFAETWGGYSVIQPLRGSGPGKHTISITLLDTKAPESGGHRFEIQALLGAGLPG